jgi:hypothetical protein
MPHTVLRTLAVGPLLAVSSGAATSPRISIGAAIGRYEALYGSPEFRAIDDEAARRGRCERPPG